MQQKVQAKRGGGKYSFFHLIIVKTQAFLRGKRKRRGGGGGRVRIDAYMLRLFGLQYNTKKNVRVALLIISATKGTTKSKRARVEETREGAPGKT